MTTPYVPKNAKELMRANLIITSAMTIGVVLMLFVIHFFAQPTPPVEAGDNLFLIIAVALGIGGVFIGQLIFNQRISNIQSGTVFEKLSEYRPALILKYALLEGPALVAVIFYFTNGDTYFIVIALVMVLLMAYNLPIKSRVANDLNLNQQEQKHLG